MPIYEYKCKKCATVFEAVQKFSDKPLKKCVRCNGAVEKLISQSAFHLKGSGWYQTDYAKKDKPAKESEKPAVCEAAPSKPACGGCPGAS